MLIMTINFDTLQFIWREGGNKYRCTHTDIHILQLHVCMREQTLTRKSVLETCEKRTAQRGINKWLNTFRQLYPQCSMCFCVTTHAHTHTHTHAHTERERERERERLCDLVWTYHIPPPPKKPLYMVKYIYKLLSIC